jgi:hypothetical protein
MYFSHLSLSLKPLLLLAKSYSTKENLQTAWVHEKIYFLLLLKNRLNLDRTVRPVIETSCGGSASQGDFDSSGTLPGRLQNYGNLIGSCSNIATRIIPLCNSNCCNARAKYKIHLCGVKNCFASRVRKNFTQKYLLSLFIISA